MLKQGTRAALVVLSSWFFFVTAAQADLGSAPRTPDLSATPGDLCNVHNPDFSERRYQEHIPYCARNVDNETKVHVYEYYHVPPSERRNYTIDHFIPLSVGGSNEVANLWPEHKQIKQTRMNLEVQIYIALRDGRITQNQAVEQIINAKMHPHLNE